MKFTTTSWTINWDKEHKDLSSQSTAKTTMSASASMRLKNITTTLEIVIKEKKLHMNYCQVATFWENVSTPLMKVTRNILF